MATTIQQVQQTLQAGQQPPITTLPPKQPITVTTAQSDMSRATGGGGQAIEESTLERRREEIVSQSGGYRSLDELDRERERKRQELYLEERQREKGGAGAGRIEIFDERQQQQQQQQQQQGSTGGGMAGVGYKSLDELDRERERKRQELYLEERQREKGGAGALGADRIEVIDEKDLKATGAMAHPTRPTATGLRSLLPTWSSTTGAAKPASEADQRLQHAAKEMSEALVLKAGELKDSAVHMTSSLGKKYSTYLPGTPARPAHGECPVCSPSVDEAVPYPSCVCRVQRASARLTGEG